MDKITNHYYLINSKDAITQSDSNNNLRIKAHNFNKVKSFKIKKVIIPYTFYTINSNNNQLIIFKNGDTSDRTITLDEGNYSISQLKTELKSKLDASLGVVQTYTITDNTINYKLTITQNSSTFIIRSVSSINKILGFSTIIDTPNAIAHTGINIYNLSDTNFIKIHSNQLTKFDTKVRTSGHDSSDILVTIPVSGYQFGDIIYYEPKNDYLFIHHSHADNEIDILLTDSNNNQLGGINGLNGQNFLIDLQFQTHKPVRKSKLRDTGFSY